MAVPEDAEAWWVGEAERPPASRERRWPVWLLPPAAATSLDAPFPSSDALPGGMHVKLMQSHYQCFKGAQQKCI